MGLYACYDTAFSTFIFEPRTQSPKTQFRGVVEPKRLPQKREVVLEVNGTRYVARADAAGHYAFHVPIPTGHAVLQVGSLRQKIEVKALAAPSTLHPVTQWTRRAISPVTRVPVPDLAIQVIGSTLDRRDARRPSSTGDVQMRRALTVSRLNEHGHHPEQYHK